MEDAERNDIGELKALIMAQTDAVHRIFARVKQLEIQHKELFSWQAAHSREHKMHGKDAQMANPWQSIEDAPKDGETHVFLLDEHDNVYIGRWDAVGGWRIVNFGGINFGGTFHASQKMIAFMPAFADAL